MRILGIDHGTKRIGLAISDELEMIAEPLPFVEADKPAQIAAIARERGIGKIVIGLPRNMDGSCGPSAAAAREYAEKLRRLVDAPIEMWDERLTTSQANRVLIEGNVSRAKRKERVDSMAAQLMLQSYLNAHANG